MEKDKNSEELLAEYLHENLNSIQQNIVLLLKDFTKKEPSRLVKGFLKVWEANMKLELKDGRIAKKQN